MKFLRILLLPLLSILLVYENQALEKYYSSYLGANSIGKRTEKTDTRVSNLSNQGGTAAKGVKINVIDEKRLQHTFRNAPGHLKDTPANRKLLERVANDPKCKLGSDQHGKTWYGLMRPDGTQVWVETRNGKITGGGVNEIPKVYNPKTGLCAPEPPKQK